MNSLCARYDCGGTHLDRWLQAEVRVHPCAIPGIAIIQVIGQGFVILDDAFAKRRFFYLYPDAHRWMYRGRPIFVESSFVFDPYVPNSE